MTSQVPITYINKYSSNMRMALNAQSSKFRGKTMEETGSGESYQLQNIIGNGTVKSRKTRNADVNYDDPTFDKVWVAAPDQKYDADLVDTLDKVRTGIELQGAYVMKHSGVIRRAWDGIFLGGSDGTGGFYGNLRTGKMGATVSAFPGGNIVPAATGAAAATGMNVAKVLAVRELFAAGFAEMDEEWFLGLTAHEITGLFNQVQVTSADFKETYKPRLSADGKSILGLAGFTFVEIELSNPLMPNYDLTLDGSSYRRNPAWTKNGMAFVPWGDQELVSSIDPIPNKFRANQVLTTTMMEATRTDNARVAIVLNA